MNKEDLICLMAASIFGGLVVNQPDELRRALEGHAIMIADEMYNRIKPLSITEIGDHHPKNCGCKDTIEKE